MSTFDMRWVERSASRKMWKEVWRAMRKGGSARRGDESELAERVKIKERIDACLEDGKIAVVTSGMDCDCVSYCGSTLVENPSVMKFVHDCQHAYSWADGPMNMSICKPSERPEAYSRDLAMEAFENGHPHVVYR